MSFLVFGCVWGAPIVGGNVGLPKEKRFRRFIAFAGEDFLFPEDRSENDTIIEVSGFSRRFPETKTALMRRIFALVQEKAGIAPQDVEITLFETPMGNWGIRGVPGEVLALSY